MKNFCRIIMFVSAAFLFGCGCEKEGGDDNGQSGKPYIKLGFSEKLVSNRDGSFEVYVSSNASWTVEAQADWLSVSPAEGKGNRNVTVKYVKSEPEEERTGIIRFAAQGTIPVKLTVKQSSRTFKNPIFGNSTLPDPYILKDEDDGGNTVYYTCKPFGGGVGISQSRKLTQINGSTNVWKLASAAEWNHRDLWAPELFHIKDKNGDFWYIYYAAGNPVKAGMQEGSYGSQRTGVLRASSPMGPYEDMGMIYTGDQPWHGGPNSQNNIDNTIYAIDMTTFEYDGQRYAVWSGNVNKSENVGGISYSGSDQAIYISTMENPWTINHARVEISRADQPWELKSRKINEGPAMLFNPDRTKLFCVYSANASWMKDYCLGWLEFDLTGNPTPEDFLNPSNWKKSSGNVFYRLDGTTKDSGLPGVNGVGHNCFTKSADGTEDWIVYHEMKFSDGGWGERYPFVQKFTWDKDGRPDFGTPVGWQEEIEVPSGEPL